MLKKERQEKIWDLLNRNDYLSIPEISSSLDVSDMTIRRDINELADKSLLVKIYGGAQKLEKIEQELSTQEKIDTNVPEKKFIGKVMNSIISDNDTIYIGAGTTMLHALPEIKKANLFVITNSLLAFSYLIYNTDYRVLLTGGEFSRTTEEFYGEIAEKSFDNLNIDIAFAATNGVFDITSPPQILSRVQSNEWPLPTLGKNAWWLTAPSLIGRMFIPSTPYRKSII